MLTHDVRPYLDLAQDEVCYLNSVVRAMEGDKKIRLSDGHETINFDECHLHMKVI